MTLVRVVLHTVAAVLPIFLARWWLASLRPSLEEFLAYGLGLGALLVLFVGLASWMPLFVLFAIRRGGRAPGEESVDRRPVHPVGWIIPLGVWGHIPVVVSLVQQDEVSAGRWETALFIGMTIVALILSWRYVASSTRPKRGQVD